MSEGASSKSTTAGATVGGARRRSRPQSARRRPASASGPQFRFARMLQRQAELGKACNAIAQKNRDLSAQIVKTEKAMEEQRAQTKEYARRAFVSARNATAQHKKLKAKHAAIFEKKLLALRRRCSNYEAQSGQVRAEINTQRMQQITMMHSITEIEQNIRTCDAGVDKMLARAKLISAELHDVSRRQEEDAIQVAREEEDHLAALERSRMEREHYLRKSQHSMAAAQRAMEKENERQAAREAAAHIRRVEEEKSLAELSESKVPPSPLSFVNGGNKQLQQQQQQQQAQVKYDAVSVQQAFAQILPFLPTDVQIGIQRLEHGGDTRGNQRHSGRTNADTLNTLVRLVTDKIRAHERDRFELMQVVQAVQRQNETMASQVQDLKRDCIALWQQHQKGEEKRSGSFKATDKASRFEAELAQMRSTLKNLRRASVRMGRVRAQVENKVSLLVSQIVKILNNTSAPSVQKRVRGSVVSGGVRGGGAFDGGLDEGGAGGLDDEATGLEKRRKAKAAAKLEREKRQALISKLGMWNLGDGFRVVENEVLLLVEAYVRHCVERFGNSTGTGGPGSVSGIATSAGDEGLTIDTLGASRKSMVSDNMGELGAMGLGGTFTMPFGPAFPPGSLKRRVAEIEHQVSKTLQREGKRGGAGLGTSFRVEEEGGVEEGLARRKRVGAAGLNRRGSVDEVFLTREEIMVSLSLEGDGELE